MLKLLLSAFAHTQISCRVMKISNHNIFFMTFPGRALKLEKVGPTFSRFNPCPSLQSVATDDRKQFQYLNKVLHHNSVPWFFEFARTRFSFFKIRQIAWHSLINVANTLSGVLTSLFSLALCKILSSMDPFVTSLYTVTWRVWPKRWARSMACVPKTVVRGEIEVSFNDCSNNKVRPASLSVF